MPAGEITHVVADAGVFIDDGVIDAGIEADADARAVGAGAFLNGRLRFVIIATEQDDAVKLAAGADEAADADDAMSDAGMVDDAAVRDDRVIYMRPVYLGTRQETRTRKNGRGHVEEVETRQFGGDVQVGLEEGADGADVLPVTLIDVGDRRGAFYGTRDDVLAEVGV